MKLNKHATTNERRRTSNGTPLETRAFMKDLLEAYQNQNQLQPSLL
jgi:hypothetical protein